MADPAHNLTSPELPAQNAERPAVERAHTPISTAGSSGGVPDPWPAIRAIGSHQRTALLVNASIWHGNQECTRGDFCDEGSLCTRHEQTPAVAELTVNVLQIVEAALARAGVDGDVATRLVDDAFAAVRRALVIDGRIEEP